jgi:CBS domain-containing protein
MLKEKEKEQPMGKSHTHTPFMPTIEEFFEKDVICLSLEDTCADAAKLMVEHHIGDVVITEDKNGDSKPIGIVTDRDIVVSCVATQKDAAKMKLSEVLKGKSRIVTARETDSIADLVKIMVDGGISRLPIVDESGNLCGILTSKRLFQFFSQGLCEMSGISKRQQKNEEKFH